MLTLIVLLMICHWMADFTHLSTTWMLKAKQFGKPLLPILAHASVHAILMGIALLFFTDVDKVLKLSAFQLITSHLVFPTI